MLVDCLGMLVIVCGFFYFGEYCIGWLILVLLGVIVLLWCCWEWFVVGVGVFVVYVIVVLIKWLVWC